MLTNLPVPYDFCPSRGLLRDCTASPINRFAALLLSPTNKEDNVMYFIVLTALDTNIGAVSRMQGENCNCCEQWNGDIFITAIGIKLHPR